MPFSAVLFVCHANVCRSPLAEAIFRHRLTELGLGDRVEVESAGVFAATGNPPHPHSVAVGAHHGVVVQGASRPVSRQDFARFSDIVAMDRRIADELERLCRLAPFGAISGERARVRLFTTLVDPGARGLALDVSDPIGREAEAYEELFDLLDRGCARLVEEVASRAR